MTDPITDMLNRIRNALMVSHPTVSIPFSKLKYEIARILEKEGFVKKIEKKGRKPRKIIEITLKYQTSRSAPCNRSAIKQEETLGESKMSKRESAISGLKRISKPGQKIYTRAKKIKRVRAGYGITIISTPKGIMTNKEARKRKLGGEIICEIW